MNEAAGLHRLLGAEPGSQRQRLRPTVRAHEAKQGDFDDIHPVVHFRRQRGQFHPGLIKEAQLYVALGGDDPAFCFGHGE